MVGNVGVFSGGVIRATLNRQQQIPNHEWVQSRESAMSIARSCFEVTLQVAHLALRSVAACACMGVLVATGQVHAATNSRGFAVDSLLLPTNNSEAASYAIDLNGDGHADNAFGTVLASLSGGFAMDIAGTNAASTLAGQTVHLVELRSSDGAFANDAAATAIWYVGQATAAPPFFDGTDTFAYDAAFVPAQFVAALSAGAFVSANPVTTTSPVDILLQLKIGNYNVAVPLQGARIAFSASAANLSQGQVNGSIRKGDVDTIVIPALAMSLNDLVQSDPTSPNSQSLLSLFDTNPTDGVISVSEVATNPLIVSIFSPDVQIRDANGNYAPNPANTTPDALSFGFGFSALESHLVLPPIFADGFD